MANPETVAAERLARALRQRIDGGPDHPWVPGIEFADGELLAALEEVERLLGLEDADAAAE